MILSSGEDRYTYITYRMSYQGAYWTFVQKLGAPIPSRSENTVFTHVVLLKDVQALAKYYASAAYGSQNETYILKTDGTRMNDGSTQEKTIQSYNVLNALEDMGLTISGPIWSYDTLLLFLIPAEFVASQTVEMVNTVIGTLLAKSKEAVEQALQIAETANKAKSAFLSSVSHDIRTPMNAIIRPQAKAKDQNFEISVTPLKYEQLLGEGSTFTVELKLRIRGQEDDPQFWKNCGVKQVFVADDGEAACRNIVRLMEPTGVKVDHATDGESAFETLCAARKAGRSYDMVLRDWKMPRMSGLATARLIREEYPENIPILLLTTYDWSDIEQEAMGPPGPSGVGNIRRPKISPSSP